MEPDSTPAPFLFVVAWRVVRRSGRRVSVVPDIITVAWAAVCRATGTASYQTGINRAATHTTVDPDFMRRYCVQIICANTRINR
jgi:hypothetical protein